MNEDFLQNIYQQAVEQPDLLSNLKICSDRYSNWQPFAEGGMKEVFSCYDQHADREVILVLPKSGSNHQLFIREGRLTAYLQHPNIVPVYDIGLLPDKRPFFTMKKLDGQDLSQLIEKAQLEELCEHFLKICDAID